ncbi:MAG: Uma2 family endonuclease [Promethearchaeota archaeon]
MLSINLDPRNLKTHQKSGKVIFTHDMIGRLHEYPIGPLLELINGEIFLIPSPSVLHQEISAKIEFLFRKFLSKHPIGKLFDAPIDVVLSEENVIIPDLVYIKNSNRGIIKEKNIAGVPDLIIEVLSSNRNHDLIYKKNLYEKCCIGEYWIVDPVNNEITIFIYDQFKKEYKKGCSLIQYQSLKSVILENIEITIKDVFSNF